MSNGEESTQLEPGDRLRRMPGIAWRMVGDEAALVNVRQDEVAQLDPVGSFIWSRLEGEETIEEVAGAVVEEFEVDLETALEDALEFAAKLVSTGSAEVVAEK